MTTELTKCRGWGKSFLSMGVELDELHGYSGTTWASYCERRWQYMASNNGCARARQWRGVEPEARSRNCGIKRKIAKWEVVFVSGYKCLFYYPQVGSGYGCSNFLNQLPNPMSSVSASIHPVRPAGSTQPNLSCQLYLSTIFLNIKKNRNTTTPTN